MIRSGNHDGVDVLPIEDVAIVAVDVGLRSCGARRTDQSLVIHIANGSDGHLAGTLSVHHVVQVAAPHPTHADVRHDQSIVGSRSIVGRQHARRKDLRHGEHTARRRSGAEECASIECLLTVLHDLGSPRTEASRVQRAGRMLHVPVPFASEAGWQGVGSGSIGTDRRRQVAPMVPDAERYESRVGRRFFFGGRTLRLPRPWQGTDTAGRTAERARVSRSPWQSATGHITIKTVVDAANCCDLRRSSPAPTRPVPFAATTSLAVHHGKWIRVQHSAVLPA